MTTPIELDATALPGGADASPTPATATLTDAGRTPSPASSRDALGPGVMLAHFRIEGRLGKGGMGEVYRATDVALDRTVALKVLPADVQHDAGRRERMIREARAQARIAHANVCHIYYVGEERGLLFFAMEYVAGESMAERLARAPVSAEIAIAWVRQAALGLREAWAHGFTHRDVKPSNLMIGARDELKLVDFGLVTRGAGPSDGDAAMTTAVGTPLYMAPEQARGDSVDFRADIYALGATLHHLLSGRPPFAGESAADLRTQHETALRPAFEARGRRGRVLALVDQVCARMMAKRPEDRFASYDDLIAELDRIDPARTTPAGFWVRGFAALVDIAIAGGAGALVGLLVPDGLVHTAVQWTVILLYQALALARWGRTFGRSLLEIEVVSVRTGRRPDVGHALLRAAIEYGIPAFLTIMSDEPAGLSIRGPIAGIGALLLLASMVWGAWMRPDKRAVWDRLAGTMVRYRRVAPR